MHEGLIEVEPKWPKEKAFISLPIGIRLGDYLPSWNQY